MFETIDKVGIEGADDAALIATLKETLASAVEGVTANARGAYGIPLLVHGAYSCDEAVLTTLLEAGADPSAESSMDGETAWSVVTDTCPQFLPLLERFGGHPTPSAEEQLATAVADIDAKVRLEANLILEYQEMSEQKRVALAEFAAKSGERCWMPTPVSNEIFFSSCCGAPHEFSLAHRVPTLAFAAHRRSERAAPRAANDDRRGGVRRG
jgi:hypothetical protein